MNAELFSATILLILVLDPFGNLPIVVSVLGKVPAERRGRVVLRECFFAYVILIAFMAGGRTFMQWLQLSDVSLTIAGGIILFLIALRMVFPHPDGVFGERAVASPSRATRRAVDRRAVGAGDGDADGVARPRAHDHWVIALSVGMAVTTLVLARGAAAASCCLESAPSWPSSA